jgi:hypothetical protein
MASIRCSRRKPVVELASADVGKTPVEPLCSATDALPPSFLAASRAG